MKKHLLLKIGLTTLLLLFFINSSAQNIHAVLNFADSLYKEQKFSLALNEFQRAYFFAENERKQALSIMITDCYLALEDYGNAKTYCDSAIYYSKNDSSKIESRFQKIICSLYEKNFGYALLKLEQLETDSNNYILSKKNFLQGICYLGIENYDMAFQLLNKSINPSDSIKQVELKQLFDNIKELKSPNPTIATLMSIVIPGSGQIYSGKYASGLNSMLLLGGLTCFGVYTPALYVLIAPMLSRYYLGGILHANQFAKDRKKQKQYRFANQILTIFPNKDELKPIFRLNKDINSFHKHVLDSDAEIPMLISVSFMGYKKFISSQDVDACVFSPSCSVYMMETIKKNGLITGFLDGLDRLLRCNSFANENDYNYNKISNKYYDPI